MPHYIADSAVFIMGKPVDAIRTITVPSVVEELKSSESKLRFDLAREQGLGVELPSREALERVAEVSGVSKDREELSLTDVDVLAKAYDLKEEAVLLTDDYAVQNVANILGIKVEPVVQKKLPYYPVNNQTRIHYSFRKLYHNCMLLCAPQNPYR